MTRAATHESDAAGDVAGYRPASALAVAAAVAGAASALALVSPVFWVLPLVGAGISLAALADVGRREAPKAGRLAAVAGLGLALGFGAQAVAMSATAAWLARGRAETAVRFWLDAIAAGRLDDARSMCTPTAADAVDRVVASGMRAPVLVRCHGSEPSTAGRLVRVTGGAGTFDVGLESEPPRRPGDPERVLIGRCDAVTRSGS